MRQTTNILLIEDNAGDTVLAKMYMKDAAFKYELFAADTFFEGMDIINQQEIDIVLLDLSLPDTQGFKTLNRYLETVSNIPVIVLTGVNNEIVGNQAVKAGAQDFLVKGQFDGKLLGRSIRFALQRYKDLQKLEDTKRELTINERRIIKAQQLAGFGNWEMDLISNEMVWHDEIFRIFGFHPGSITTGLSDYLGFVHFEDRETIEDFFNKAMKDGKLYKEEHRIVVDGTSIKWLAIHAQVFYDELTNRTMLVGGVMDITKRKENEQLIAEQNINRQTSLLKEEALQDMSFHIRTPLSSIVNLLYLMETTTISPQQSELVEGLKTSVDDLALMINNLMNFSMLVSQNMKTETEEFPIKDFVAAIRKAIQIKVDNAKIKLDFTLGEDLPEKIKADSKKITQIIYNLVDHATRYTPPNNRITIDVNITNVDNQANLTIRVSYAGKILTSSQIKELMEENKILETIKNENSDSEKQQLALAIVGKLTKILKGTFNISNKGSEMTFFDVSLPVTAVKIIQTDATMPDSPVKILLVEDHFLNQMATKKLLTAWSPFVTVDIAENGMIAVEKFKAHGYDIILMDLQMPTMNGFDATVRIREKSQVPILALTASASKNEADKCFEIGMNDYISKPFKPQELYFKIMTALAGVAAVKV
ncbi:MAG: response regulator [Saprospiraceae bacterium]|nr:response regulator [Saprospiraceae bacterium]